MPRAPNRIGKTDPDRAGGHISYPSSSGARPLRARTRPHRLPGVGDARPGARVPSATLGHGKDHAKIS